MAIHSHVIYFTPNVISTRSNLHIFNFVRFQENQFQSKNLEQDLYPYPTSMFKSFVKVDDKSSIFFIHFYIFSIHFFIAPNRLDFESVLKKSEQAKSFTNIIKLGSRWLKGR